MSIFDYSIKMIKPASLECITYQGETPFSVVFQVIDNSTGNPVSGLTVKGYYKRPDSSMYESTATEASGTYTATFPTDTLNLKGQGKYDIWVETSTEQNCIAVGKCFMQPTAKMSALQDTGYGQIVYYPLSYFNEVYAQSEATRQANETARQQAEAARQASYLNKANSLLVKNLLVNGGFDNGTTNWNGVDAVASGIGQFTATSQYDNINNTIANYANYAGKKIYFRAKFKADSNQVFAILNDGVSQTQIAHTGDNTFKVFSDIRTIDAAPKNLVFKIQDNRASGWTLVESDFQIAICLTDIFGAGKEPSLATMDSLFSLLPVSYFEGDYDFMPIRLLINYIDTKANRKQEAWQVPTLLNGAVAFDGGVKFRKNEFGELILSGSIAPVSAGTTIFTLPVGYRPARIKRCSAITSATSIRVNIENTGNVLVAAGTISTFLSLDGIVIPLD